MLTLTNLTGTLSVTGYTEPPVHHHTVGMELGSGKFAALRVGPAGLVVTNGKWSVAFPINALVAAAEAAATSQAAEALEAKATGA